MSKRIAIIADANIGVATLTRLKNESRRAVAAKRAAEPTLLKQHEDYIERWKRDGKRTVRFNPPCKCPTLEVTVPELRGGTWDSLMTCPHCKALFMTVRTPNRVTTGEVIPQ